MAISEFGKAFRAARNAGNKTFTFNGKSYTTELASASKPSAYDMGKQKAADTVGTYKNMADAAAKDDTVSPEAKAAVARNLSSAQADYENYGASKEAGQSRGMRSSTEPNPADAEAGQSRGIKSDINESLFKRGGKIKKMAKGGSVRSTASKRADGIAGKGHTRGRVI